jgi:hypothetical protein
MMECGVTERDSPTGFLRRVARRRETAFVTMIQEMGRRIRRERERRLLTPSHRVIGPIYDEIPRTSNKYRSARVLRGVENTPAGDYSVVVYWLVPQGVCTISSNSPVQGPYFLVPVSLPWPVADHRQEPVGCGRRSRGSL